MCSKLTIKIPELRQPCSSVSIVNFEHVIAGWEWKKIMEQSIKVEQQ